MYKESWPLPIASRTKGQRLQLPAIPALLAHLQRDLIPRPAAVTTTVTITAHHLHAQPCPLITCLSALNEQKENTLRKQTNRRKEFHKTLFHQMQTFTTKERNRESIYRANAK